MPEKIYTAAVAVAGGAAGWSWLETANDFASLVLTIVATVGAAYSALYWIAKFKAERKNKNEEDK